MLHDTEDWLLLVASYLRGQVCEEDMLRMISILVLPPNELLIDG